MRNTAAASTLLALLSASALLGHASSLHRTKPTWWSFREIRKPPVPADNGTAKASNPIDAFLRQKLAANGLDFSPPADNATLIRRVHFDLTGLPPEPDRLSEPYARAVDRLLASPRYGERWGRHWLDIVRFGETDGGEHNYERFNAWPYRDYVIDAFNRDLPYNQFIRDQIAGDLLDPGDRNKIAATGFLVAGPWDQVSAELNKDPAMRKLARMDELDDMVTAVGSTFLGLTVNCARCHDHKFDPIPARDYYRLTAAFTDAGFGEREVATAEEKAAYEARVKPLRAHLALTEQELRSIEDSVSPTLLTSRYRAFDGARKAERQRIPLNPLYNRNEFPPVTARHFRMVVLGQSSGRPRIDRLDLGPANFTARDWKGERAATVEEPIFLPIEFDEPRRVSEITWSTDAKAGARDGMVTIYRFEYSADGSEWNSLCSSTDHVSRLEADLPSLSDEEIDAALDPARRTRRGELAAKKSEIQNQIAQIPLPARIYAVKPRELEKAFLLDRGSVSKPVEEVTPGGLTCFPSLSPEFQETNVAARTAGPTGSTAGGSLVKRPRALLADWIANPRNPLTARVIVNRVWYYHFGAGLVNTPSDFGVMGDRPSHPELLDWLAVEFMARGWSLKWLHRQILLSRAYRQSSYFNVKASAVDAGNRLLWRMPLKRMDAETLRDSILQVTGSLNLKAGGPGFLLQRKGDRGSYIYKALDNDGPDVWRRAVYRFVVRGGERIILDSFDCPDPAVATPQRQVSNTPVQALALMNNPFIVKQASILAQRLERGTPGNGPLQIRAAYRLLLGRNPRNSETARAVKFVADHSLPEYCRALLNSNEFIYVP